jgi:competence protein ComEC
MPLIAYQFHIVAPVGFVVNVLLLPVAAVVLGLGFLTLLCGLLAPWIVWLPAAAFDASLRALQGIVDASAYVHLGHAFVAGPAGWWLIGFYAWLAAALAIPTSRTLRRWAWRGLGGWVIMGLLLALFPRPREGLRCTFLAVGHGCAVVIELPSGETLLYDAGTFGSARRGQTIIQHSLWERGITAVDAVIVSHADIDHFNAAAGLMQTLPVGTVFCGRTFLDFTQKPVVALCETASREGVAIRLLQQADRLQVGGGEVELSLLHPPPHWSSEQDNANSLVLRVRYAGRTLLLTGDVEGDGLDKLLEQPAQPVDLLLSPHHGSRNANPPALNDWASPQYVVISGGDAESAALLRGSYSQAERVLSTHDCGAITVHITADGKMTVDPWTAPE